MCFLLKNKGNKLKEQLKKEMQECREIENKSMNIEVQEPRAIASAVSIPFAGRKISTLSTLQG